MPTIAPHGIPEAHPYTRLLVEAARGLDINHECVDKQGQLYRFWRRSRELFSLGWALDCNDLVGTKIAASPPLNLDVLRRQGIHVVKSRWFDSDAVSASMEAVLNFSEPRLPVAVNFNGKIRMRRRPLIAATRDELLSVVNAHPEDRRQGLSIVEMPNGRCYSALVCVGHIIEIVELEARLIAPRRGKPDAAGQRFSGNAAVNPAMVRTLVAREFVAPDQLSHVDLKVVCQAATALSLGFTSVDFSIGGKPPDAGGVVILDVHQAPRLDRHARAGGGGVLEPIRMFLRCYFDLAG